MYASPREGFLLQFSEKNKQFCGLAVNKIVYLDSIKRIFVPFIKKYHSDGNYKLNKLRTRLMSRKLELLKTFDLF